VAGREPIPVDQELWPFPPSTAGEAPRSNTPSPTATLYAELPDNEGVFAHNNLTLDRRDGSLYEIQPRANNRSAFVTLCNNEEVQKRALLNPKALLLPVCEYEEIPNARQHTRIVVQVKGEAEREEAGWRVKPKIKVKFS
jgi:hypothetical protein